MTIFAPASDLPAFLATELTAAERDPATARFRVIPVPLERTVSYGAGTAGGPAAILAASGELERLWRGTEPCAAGIVTGTPLACDGPLPHVMTGIAERTGAAAVAGQVPVTLGGEHSVTYGAVRGIAEATGRPIGIVQIDAHADLRRAYQGERHSHASVIQLLAEDVGTPVAQLGVRALSRNEATLRRDLGIFHVDAETLVTERQHSVSLPEDFPEDVYVTFDLDGLDPSVLPDTGTPVPGGIGFWQAIHLVEAALDGRRMVGCDVVELAPRPGGTVSDFTAAQVAYALMALA